MVGQVPTGHEHAAEGDRGGEAEWALDLVDESLEIDGWLLVPGDLEPADQERWIQVATEEISGLSSWDGEDLSPEVIHELLAGALRVRAASESMAVLQVWPPLGDVTAMCHIDVVASDALPTWDRPEDVVHRVDEPHLGPGLQITTRRTISVEGREGELSSTTFAFDDGRVTLLIGLTETLTSLVALSLPGLITLMRNVRLARVSDGSWFSPVEPAHPPLAEEWEQEGAAWVHPT